MKITDVFILPSNLDYDDKHNISRDNRYFFIGKIARNCMIIGEIFIFETDMYIQLDKDKFREYTIRYVIKDNSIKGAEEYIKDGDCVLIDRFGLLNGDFEYVAMKYIDERGVIVNAKLNERDLLWNTQQKN